MKKIIGIYTYNKGIERIKFLNTLNFDKIYKLEGPFTVHDDEYIKPPLLINTQFNKINPDINLPIIKSPTNYKDPFDDTFNKF